MQLQVEIACRHMLKVNKFWLAKGANHPNPICRYAAAYAIGTRKIKSLEDDLIDLLMDPDGFVSQMARQSLIKMNGKDLGPKPTATGEELLDSVMAWRKNKK